jgi:hypothetical protein
MAGGAADFLAELGISSKINTTESAAILPAPEIVFPSTMAGGASLLAMAKKLR